MSLSGRTFHRNKPPFAAIPCGGHISQTGLRDNIPFTGGGGLPRNLNSAYQPTFTGSPVWVNDIGGMGVQVAGSQSIDVPNYFNIAAGDFTVRVVHQPSVYTNATYNALFSKSIGGVSELEVYLDNTGHVSYVRIGNSAAAVSVATGMTIGLRSDFIVTRQGTSVTFYVNGQQAGSPITSSFTQGITGGVLSLGRETASGGSDYQGTYYFLQTATRAWSPAEIAAAYWARFGSYVIRPSGYKATLAAGGFYPWFSDNGMSGGFHNMGLN